MSRRWCGSTWRARSPSRCRLSWISGSARTGKTRRINLTGAALLAAPLLLQQLPLREHAGGGLLAFGRAGDGQASHALRDDRFADESIEVRTQRGAAVGCH